MMILAVWLRSQRDEELAEPRCSFEMADIYAFPVDSDEL